MPPNRITSILAGRRGISADTALRLSRYLGMNPELWLDLQKRYELRSAERASGTTITSEIRLRRRAT